MLIAVCYKSFLFLRIRSLREKGEFLPKWAKAPRVHLNFGTEQDLDGEERTQIAQGRRSAFPQYVLDMIGA